MDKSKHFVFIVAIVIALLLIVSNLATPVHATGTGIIDSVPTSMGIPIAISSIID